MKKMYRVEANYYTDVMEGRGSEWKQVDGYKATMEEAEAIAQTIKRGYANNGDWRIVERTIDEETFNVIDTVVKHFDYWKEIGKREWAEESIKHIEEKIAKEEEGKKRAKTEAGKEKKERKIAEYKKEKERYEEILRA